MTPEEKAKAYDEALERAKSFQQKFGGDYAGYIFPELRESEDKWFIKELQGFLESYGADYFGTGAWQKFHDWLEKQKEQKPAEWSEEDEKIIQSLILAVNKYVFFAGIETNKIVSFLKSLRPSWKPSEEQMLKDAIEGEIISTGLHTGIAIYDEKYTKRLDKFKRGDRVRVIVLPKEDEEE